MGCILLYIILRFICLTVVLQHQPGPHPEEHDGGEGGDGLCAAGGRPLHAVHLGHSESCRGEGAGQLLPGGAQALAGRAPRRAELDCSRHCSGLFLLQYVVMQQVGVPGTDWPDNRPGLEPRLVPAPVLVQATLPLLYTKSLWPR